MRLGYFLHHGSATSRWIAHHPAACFRTEIRCLSRNRWIAAKPVRHKSTTNAGLEHMISALPIIGIGPERIQSVPSDRERRFVPEERRAPLTPSPHWLPIGWDAYVQKVPYHIHFRHCANFSTAAALVGADYGR
jgi:hypothetical protein